MKDDEIIEKAEELEHLFSEMDKFLVGINIEVCLKGNVDLRKLKDFTLTSENWNEITWPERVSCKIKEMHSKMYRFQETLTELLEMLGKKIK